MTCEVGHEFDDRNLGEAVPGTRVEDPDERKKDEADHEQHPATSAVVGQLTKPDLGQVRLYGVLGDHILAFQFDQTVEQFGSFVIDRSQ